MFLSQHLNHSFKRFFENKFLSLLIKFSFVTIILICNIQLARSETCATDVSYLLPQIHTIPKYESEYSSNQILAKFTIDSVIKNYGGMNKTISSLKDEISQYHTILESDARNPLDPDYKMWVQDIVLVEEEQLKQVICLQNGGHANKLNENNRSTTILEAENNKNFNKRTSEPNIKNRNDKSGTPDIEVFFRGNTYFARVRPNTSYPADCTVEFTVTGQTYSAPNNVYLNDIAGNIFSEALGGNPQSEVDVSARATCKMSSAEKDRRETKQKQSELKRQFDKKKK